MHHQHDVINVAIRDELFKRLVLVAVDLAFEINHCGSGSLKRYDLQVEGSAA